MSCSLTKKKKMERMAVLSFNDRCLMTAVLLVTLFLSSVPIAFLKFSEMVDSPVLLGGIFFFTFMGILLLLTRLESLSIQRDSSSGGFRD